MKKVAVMFVVALVLSGGALAYWLAVTADRRAVCRLAENVAALAHKEASNLPHAGMLKFGKLDEFFCGTVTIRCAKPAFGGTFSTEELKLILTSAFRRVDFMEVRTGSVAAEVSGDQATFSFDAEVSGAVQGEAGAYSEVVIVRGGAEKIDGRWKVSSLTVEPVVQR